MLTGRRQFGDPEGPLNARSLAVAGAIHVLAFLFFWGLSKVFFPKPEELIPIDMTIVPPWAQQTDDPDPDPNPPPKPEEQSKPEEQPKPEPPPEPKVVEPKVEAVEKVVEKKRPEKIDLRKNAKLVKTPPKPQPSLRVQAKLMTPPPQVKAVGKGTAADKPLSMEEFIRKMNEGYRIGARNQIASGEAQRCASLIKQAIFREWDKETFTWHPGLKPLSVALQFGAGGTVRGFRILEGSGDAAVDRTAQSALRRLRSIPGLSATFLEQFPELTVAMRPVGM